MPPLIGVETRRVLAEMVAGSRMIAESHHTQIGAAAMDQEQADADEYAAHSGPEDAGEPQMPVNGTLEQLLDAARGSGSARTRALGDRVAREVTRLRRVVGAEADAERARAAAEAAKEAVRDAWSSDGEDSGDGTDG